MEPARFCQSPAAAPGRLQHPEGCGDALPEPLQGLPGMGIPRPSSLSLSPQQRGRDVPAPTNTPTQPEVPGASPCPAAASPARPGGPQSLSRGHPRSRPAAGRTHLLHGCSPPAQGLGRRPAAPLGSGRTGMPGGPGGAGRAPPLSLRNNFSGSRSRGSSSSTAGFPALPARRRRGCPRRRPRPRRRLARPPRLARPRLPLPRCRRGAGSPRERLGLSPGNGDERG